MGLVTFQAVDGLERGQVFSQIPTPVNIGREEDNHIRLNDERVSRFHAKVQEHEGKFILTDLESTNGTRVNGHPVTMHVLQIGDQVHIGRCLLIFGTHEELAARSGGDDDPRGTVEEIAGRATDAGLEDCPELFRDGPPPLPERLTGVQTAQTEDVLAFINCAVLRTLYAVAGDADAAGPLDMVQIPARSWRRLQQLQIELASYLRRIGQPELE